MGRPHHPTTAQRGYGRAHQTERERRLPLYTEHHPCGYCGRPLGPDRHRWHLPHNAQRTAYLPGFWHDTCNSSDGGKRRRSKRRGMAVARRVTSRPW